MSNSPNSKIEQSRKSPDTGDDRQKMVEERGNSSNPNVQIGWSRFGQLRRGLTDRQRERILKELFLSRDADFLLYLWRFIVLLCLSSAIASFGLLQNSTAVVIGAMLVAPFMEPILASSAALIMSWPRRLVRSLLLVLCGAAASFAMAYLISKITPDVEWTSQEVMVRTRPNLFDLGIAAAAGGAAVFTMIYRISAAIPGVAVAVALLPPLAAAGIAAEQRLYVESIGALLLFATNFATILLVGAFGLLLHGFVPQIETEKPKRLTRRGIAITLILVATIAVPLYKKTTTMFHEIRLEADARQALKNWYPGTQQEVHRVEANGDKIQIVMSGTEFERDYKILAKAISELAGKPIRIEVKWLGVTTVNEAFLETDVFN